MIRIAVYDDHVFITDALHEQLSAHHDIDIVGLGNTIDEVLLIIKNTKPDLLIADIFSDENRGTTLFTEAFKLVPKLKIIIFSSITNQFLMDSLYDMGILAIINKSKGFDVLYDAIKEITKENSSPTNKISPLPSLTPREKDIAQFLSKGYASKEIASTLGSSLNTIENQKKALLKKFKCNNSTELIVKLAQMGLISII